MRFFVHSLVGAFAGLFIGWTGGLLFFGDDCKGPLLAMLLTAFGLGSGTLVGLTTAYIGWREERKELRRAQELARRS